MRCESDWSYVQIKSPRRPQNDALMNWNTSGVVVHMSFRYCVIRMFVHLIRKKIRLRPPKLRIRSKRKKKTKKLCGCALTQLQTHLITRLDFSHYGSEWPRIQSEVLGHSLVRWLVLSHRSLICSLAYSPTPKLIGKWMIRWLFLMCF